MNFTSNFSYITFNTIFFIMIFFKKSSSKFSSFIQKEAQIFSYSQNTLLSNQKINDSIFIRHAHSQFNKACQQYRKKHQIDYDWDALCNHPGFENIVAYNPDFIDCSLTEKGIEQCYLTSHNIDLKKVDVIMVSPHQRALETCQQIIKFSNQKHKPPIIVQPLVAGSLWSSCDISKSLDDKLLQFKQYDFSRMLKQPDLWFIQNLKMRDKLQIYQQISKRKLKTFKDKQLLVLQLIRTKKVEEDRRALRQRAWSIKQAMQNLKKIHCNMLVISHYYIIQYVNTRYFDDANHKPIHDLDLENCYPYYNNLSQLLNYK